MRQIATGSGFNNAGGTLLPIYLSRVPPLGLTLCLMLGRRRPCRWPNIVFNCACWVYIYIPLFAGLIAPLEDCSRIFLIIGSLHLNDESMNRKRGLKVYIF